MSGWSAEAPDAARKAARNQVIQLRNMHPQMKAQYPIPSLDDVDDSELPIIYSADTTLAVDWKLDRSLVGLRRAITVVVVFAFESFDDKISMSRQLQTTATRSKLGTNRPFRW